MINTRRATSYCILHVQLAVLCGPATYSRKRLSRMFDYRKSGDHQSLSPRQPLAAVEYQDSADKSEYMVAFKLHYMICISRA